MVDGACIVSLDGEGGGGGQGYVLRVFLVSGHFGELLLATILLFGDFI